MPRYLAALVTDVPLSTSSCRAETVSACSGGLPGVRPRILAASRPSFVRSDISRRSKCAIAERTRDGIAAARKRGKKPGRPPLPGEKVSAAEQLIKAGMTPGQAAKQLNIGRATAYRIAQSLR